MRTVTRTLGLLAAPAVLAFAGVPGRTYAVQFTDEQHPTWQPLTNVTADAFGEFVASDSPPKTITNRVYRSTIPRP